jgi:hypothetical protein
MAEQRIINAPIAEDYTNDSYVLIDGATNGTRKILISNILKPPEPDYLYNWDFTNSLVDKVQGSAVTLGANAVRTSSGVSFTGKGDRIIFDRTVTENILSDKVIEIDVAEMNFQGNTNYDMNFLVIPSPTSNATGILEFMKGLGWGIWYNGEAFIISSSLDRNLFNNGTIKIISKNTQTAQHYDISLYFNNQLLGQLSDIVFRMSTRESDLMTLGSSNVSSPSNGDQCYDMTITGVRIYANEGV